jgi:cysteinyl-tRNA synthetase
MNNQLYITNSLTRTKELFTSITPGHVGLYVCGPTVSGESHLGHARPYITYDVVNRYLQHLGYKVRYVRNITDAGHFEEEGREAEDKMATKSALEKLEPMELATKYSRLFHWGMKSFNCLEPTIEPTATGHIVEQIEMIKDIIAKGYAYETNGSVYFNVKKYAEQYKYGELSGRSLENLLENTRNLDGQSEKEDAVDFALWKSAPIGHIQRWASPWGDGFPGWHIECSAMACKYLGAEFDIHAGGMDLLFPHHESEIAQSTVVNGKAPVRYWMHNNMITIDGKKMGKSYNNVISLTDLFAGTHPILAQAYHPMVVRFYILQTHYRSTLDFGNDALQASEKGLRKLIGANEILKKLSASENKIGANKELDNKVAKLVNDFAEFMNDDFSTAKVLANMFELAPIINSIKDGLIKITEISTDTFHLLQQNFTVYFEKILGLQAMDETNDNSKLDGVLQLLISIRAEAKLKKDFATSDKVRNELLEVGIQLKDEKDGKVSYSFE